MEITTENLEIIYNRANQYAITKYGTEPSEIQLLSDGRIRALWGNTCRGEYYETEEEFTADKLTEDLDKVAKERIEQEEKQRKEREYELLKQENARKKRELEDRKAQYLKLKKEFES